MTTGCFASLDCMATRRIFSTPGAVYHCMTRTVNRERLFDDTTKEILRRQIHQVSEFCGVQVITYALMSNHFHILVRVPSQGVLSDAELIRRYRILYPKPNQHATAHATVLEEVLAPADSRRKCCATDCSS